ncbi:MAG: amino acid permease, partial [Cyanobacteria bacterium]|nr:amino acid permease [Cyanobacteriota bacterium]
LPRQLMALGDRLVFSNGILILGFLTALLIVIFQASSHLIMPLFAIGVFLSFTLAQSGMIRHHWIHRQAGWKASLGINLMGALTTGLVTLLLTFEKFLEGAWMVIVAVPPLVWMFQVIKNHYQQIANALALPPTKTCPIAIDHTVLVLVSSLNRGTIPALEYAKSISENVEAVHVEMNPDSTEKLRTQWNEWGCGIPLVILKSPFRSVIQPLIHYIQEVEDRYTHDLVTIIVPEIVPRKFWHHILHNQTALLLKTLIHLHKGKVVTTVRYYLEE